MGTKRSAFQPGHDGRSRAVSNTPGMHGLARGADAFKGYHVPGNLARDGSPKRHHDVPAHSGMTRRQTAMVAMGHATAGAPDANAANPLAPTAPGKTFAPARPMKGQRSRTMDTPHGGQPGENHARNVGHGVNHDLGRQILAEATCAPDDRRALAHLGVGSNPLPRRG